MRRHRAGWGFVFAVALVASAAAAFLLGSGAEVAPSAYALKAYQTQVLGTIGTITIYSQTVSASEKSDAVKVAEGQAATAIQSFGQCASRPRVVSKHKFNVVVQLTGQPCDPHVLDCNTSGGNGGGVVEGSTTIPSNCGTTTTTEEGGFE